MPYRRTKLSERKADKLLSYFVAEVTARTAAALTGVSKDTAALFYRKIRSVIAVKLLENSPFDGEVEIDESYFGGMHKGKRGRGAAGKVPVFGILKRGGKVYTTVIPDLTSETLLPIDLTPQKRSRRYDSASLIEPHPETGPSRPTASSLESSLRTAGRTV